MKVRKISANFIFTGIKILKKAIIELDETGKILNIIDTKGNLQEEESLEFYSGVIVPGFVNAHCHLELSHMKGLIDSNTVQALPGFIDEIISKRTFPDDLQEKIQKADFEMQKNGIVAVGDISNTDDSFNIKKNSKIYYHTFVETFTINNKKSDEAFETAKTNLKKLKNIGLKGTIVPHASYSVPDKLYSKIENFDKENSKIISVHNQETASEDEAIVFKTGALSEVLQNKGFELSNFSYNGKSAIENTLVHQNPNNNILLIHNTFSDKENIKYAEKFSKNIYWVFCPLSNLYIENTLPNMPMFFKNDLKTCIGTDSYASNTELSILSELKTITKHFPEIPFKDLIKSACLNGAKALKIDNKYGSIEKGKTPGINLISDFDYHNMHLKKESKIRVLN